MRACMGEEAQRSERIDSEILRWTRAFGLNLRAVREKWGEVRGVCIEDGEVDEGAGSIDDDTRCAMRSESCTISSGILASVPQAMDRSGMHSVFCVRCDVCLAVVLGRR
jgi:hypothetical protein